MPASNDLTTLFSTYVRTLLAAHSGKDATTLIAKNRATVKAAVVLQGPGADDENTMYDRYLKS